MKIYVLKLNDEYVSALSVDGVTYCDRQTDAKRFTAADKIACARPGGLITPDLRWVTINIRDAGDTATPDSGSSF